MRRIFLDIETDGLDPESGARLVEVACVEIIDGRKLGRYLHFQVNADPLLPEKLGFSDIADELAGFVRGSELVIHNAPFDLAFLDHEFSLVGKPSASGIVSGVVDTLAIAKKLRPDETNTLDALCADLGVKSDLKIAGALLNARLLVAVHECLKAPA